MPGGDLAAKFPARMLLAAASDCMAIEEVANFAGSLPLASMLPQGDVELQLVLQQLARKSAIPLTTSLGRVLDALATGFGLCSERTYDGEPAMRFEAFAAGSPPDAIVPDFEIPIRQEDSQLVIATPALFAWLIEEGAFTAPIKAQQIYARACHLTIARSLAKAALDLAASQGTNRIGLTGGVAVNAIISSEIQRIIEASGYQFLEHARVPPGDAGVSFGQCAVAASQFAERK
jgi:hydrogenase maturation protein HypF